MRYPKPDENYSCEVFCQNFMEIEQNLNVLNKDVQNLKEGDVDLTGAAVVGALGYKPADEEDVSRLQEEIDDLKDKEVDVDLTGYATEVFVKEYAQPKGNYLTEHQSLDGYAKKSDIPTDYAKAEHTHSQYLTEHQDLSDYAKTSQIPTKTSQLTNDSNFVPKSVTDSLEARILSLQQAEAPSFVDGVSEMTDKSKSYVNTETGTIWIYKSATVRETVKEQIVGTSDNPWESGRLGSSGTVSAQSGYVVTPYIDLMKYSVPFELHLGGIPFSYEHTSDSYNTHSQYGTDKTHIKREVTQTSAFQTYWENAVYTNIGDGSAKISFTPPVTNKSDVVIGYVRFGGKGTEANSDVYVTYEADVVTEAWVDTGVSYGGGSGETIVDITSFNLTNPSVKEFVASADYNDNDYSYTQANDYASSDYFRKDLPLPIVLNWTKDASAIEYTVTINTVSGILTTGMQTHYVKDNKFVLYNLIPNTTYFYRVYGLYADSTKKLLKDGNFTTSADRTRMLNIDGIQNVRDIGGYSGYNSKKVKYGLIYRGSAMDEKVADICKITDKGKQEFVRVGIKTDLDLRGANNVTESALGSDVDFFTNAYSYLNYASAITDTTHMGYFKNMLEYIVTQLTANKPVYIHCSGGCDRTGTLVFLLLGLLGISESDLAKEYELSSFSNIGKGRTRNSSSYDYKGMVNAIKAYSGTTITDKFVAFATACGVSSDTITSFRNLMLQ